MIGVASRAALGVIAFAAFASAAERGTAPFVVTYRCDGGRFLAVGYPAYADAARAPVRLAWQGTTVELMPARAASGARYVNPKANLEWWTKGNAGFLNRLSDNTTLVSGCSEQ